MTEVYIATEDALSEAVANRLITDTSNHMHVAVSFGKKGNGYLRSNINSFRILAQSYPILLLTDLDNVRCPASLIAKWCGRRNLPEKFLFRVAVRETEAWILADRHGFAAFSGVPHQQIPLHPESLRDPKAALLSLVERYGRRSIKADILPARRSTARVGLAYNQALCNFVNHSWSIERAAAVSDSLNRARLRLHELRLALDCNG
jgi:hypothetical protein